jgi:hypothetical protein
VRHSLRKLVCFAASSLLVATGAVLTAPPAVAAPPTNDTIPGAKTIGTVPFVDRVSTREATRGAVGGNSCYGDSHSVWYRYAPTQSRTLDLDTLQSSYGAIVTVWRKTPGGMVLEGDNCSQTLRHSFTAGGTYYVMGSDCCNDTGGDLVLRVRPGLRVSASVAPEGTVSNASGDATVEVTVTCSRPATVDAGVSVRQRISDTLIATGSGSAGGVSCTPAAPGRFTLLVLADAAPFRAGNAGVQPSAGSCDVVCASASSPRQVVLLRWVR